MDYFRLLEVTASEVFNSHALNQHSRTTHYLAALGTLSHALARRQQAISEIERVRELVGRNFDNETRSLLEMQRRQAEHDQELAELELRGIDLWIGTLSGAFVTKDQLAQALKEFADDVAGSVVARTTFPSDEELDQFVAGLGAGHHPGSKPNPE